MTYPRRGQAQGPRIHPTLPTVPTDAGRSFSTIPGVDRPGSSRRGRLHDPIRSAKFIRESSPYPILILRLFRRRDQSLLCQPPQLLLRGPAARGRLQVLGGVGLLIGGGVVVACCSKPDRSRPLLQNGVLRHGGLCWGATERRLRNVGRSAAWPPICRWQVIAERHLWLVVCGRAARARQERTVVGCG
jgi:hypothetical protein